MSTLDLKVIEKILSDEKAMQLAKEFIQKHQAASQGPASAPPADPEML